MSKDNSNLWITTILPFGLGFFITSIFRTINAVLAHPIIRSLSLSPVEIGFVTSTYAFTFALNQLPLGILLDSWGARKTQTLFFLIGGVGIIIFGLAPNAEMLAFGRAILGVGMAGGLMAAFKAVADRVIKERIPFYNGAILAMGGLGALVAATPAKLFEIRFGWRMLCIILGISTFLIALLVFFLNDEKLTAKDKEAGLSERVGSLKKIYRSSFFWRISPLFIFSLGGFIAMQGLWLGPWLEHVVGLTPRDGADYLSVIAIAMTLGFISGGLFSRLSAILGIRLISVVVVGIALHIVTQIVIVANYFTANYAVWFIYGYLAQVPMVNYAILAQYFGPKVSGRALTAVNILIFLFAFLFQYLFGLIVHLWPKILSAAHPAAGYKTAFSCLILLEILAFIWFIAFGKGEKEQRMGI